MATTTRRPGTASISAPCRRTCERSRCASKQRAERRRTAIGFCLTILSGTPFHRTFCSSGREKYHDTNSSRTHACANCSTPRFPRRNGADRPLKVHGGMQDSICKRAASTSSFFCFSLTLRRRGSRSVRECWPMLHTVAAAVAAAGGGAAAAEAEPVPVVKPAAQPKNVCPSPSSPLDKNRGLSR